MPLPSTTTFHVRWIKYIKNSIRELSWLPSPSRVSTRRLSRVPDFDKVSFFSCRGNVCRSYRVGSSLRGAEMLFPMSLILTFSALKVAHLALSNYFESFLCITIMRITCCSIYVHSHTAKEILLLHKRLQKLSTLSTAA